MKREFVHLHVHTDYSLLESNNRILPLAKKLIEHEMPGCAITDKGNLFGALAFYNAFKANGLKPVIGYQAFLTTQPRTDRQTVLKIGEAAYYELILLAQDLCGYQNLVQLASKAYTEGFHHKPRLDFELLANHSKGIIALSGGRRGIAEHFIRHDDFDRAREHAGQLQDIYGTNNFFLEVQDHSLADEKKLRTNLLDLSAQLAIPLVATNSIHYLNQTDARAHETLLCIGAGQTVQDASRPNLGAETFYLRSTEEMWRLFGDELPEALRRTTEIFERCRPELPNADDKDYLPQYPIPVESGCQTVADYFEQVAWAGFAWRKQKVWDQARANDQLKYSAEDYEQRLRRELDIVKQMGYPGYFLIVWDFVRYARDNDIPVGPGRGSAAGSLVAYCLEITDVDPIQYDLLFERFLNPERVSMPDIDIDFCVHGREAVIQHVIKRYGRSSVCQIITFGTMASKAVIKDVGRALAVPYSEVEKIAKLIPPPVRGRNVSITQALEQVEELRTLIEKDQQAAQVIDLARRLEGCARHTSVHAAGVVIAPRPLHELIPVSNSPKSELTTQFAMNDLEKTGMLKMDFLALTTLTIINDCLKSLKRDDITISWENIPLDDAPTMQIFGDGKTEAIFQFESPGMQEICRRLKPKGIEDLAALNALYRPGPLDGGMVDDFIARHRGQKTVRYIVPEMKEILSNTLGILVYQEQIMQLAQKLAGYSLGEADLMRRAMGKKKREEMALHQDKFVSGAVSRNIKKEKAEQIFSLMAQFADYGFNRSHSVAYAYLAFQTAYLKAHHPAHFYAAVMSHETQDAAKIYKYAAELRELGVQLLPPDINESKDSFTPLNKAVRFGLSAVKGLGENGVKEILSCQRDQFFSSLHDFANRAGGSVNRRALESLIGGGAFDSLNRETLPLAQWRARLSASIDDSLALAKKQSKDQDKGQHGLFFAGERQTAREPDLPQVESWSNQTVWKTEKQALGFYLTSHPLDGSEPILAEILAAPIGDLPQRLNQESAAQLAPQSEPVQVWTAGVISNLQLRTSKKGSKFAIFRLEDRTGGIKCLVWDEAFNKCAGYLRDDELVTVAGALEVENEGSLTLIAHKVVPLAEAKPGRAACVVITAFADTARSESYWEDLLQALHRFKGKCQVILELALAGGARVRIAAHTIVSVNGCLALENELRTRGCEVVWHPHPIR